VKQYFIVKGKSKVSEEGIFIKLQWIRLANLGAYKKSSFLKSECKKDLTQL
jgi:hypothetical protein